MQLVMHSRGRRARPTLFLRTIAPVAIAMGGVTCMDALAPLPEGAVRFEPHAVYAFWWEQVVACSGRTGSLVAVDFYVLPGRASFEAGGTAAAGAYDPSGHRIVLAGDFEFHGGVVRHEMLHALVPELKHPREYFAERCWNVVPCDDGCVAEAGAPSIPSAAVSVPLDELVVEASVQPGTPSGQLHGGRFMLVLTARNPHPYAIRVALAPSLDPDPRPRGFSVRVETDGQARFFDRRVLDAGAGHFRANEVRRAVFDYQVGATGDDALAPGDYELTGSFSGRPTTQAALFVIRP